ncbi:hypothetical protein A3J90_00895 [candidate division WOR-1 bacterium RIFOXYC2_FULL_37_10]|nr:MAG: hypothetical protein A3J90_00895 [candidate division WOR-1 bacterium RIFOXYC2_FULL_37_10]
MKMRRSLSLLESVLFCKQLASLLKAGIQLNSALKFLSSQSKGRLKEDLKVVSSQLEQGISFADAIYSRGLFSKEIVNMFKIAEKNAFLDETLIRISDLFERKYKLYQTLKKSLVYPCVVLIASLFSFFGMIFFVLPTYSDLFSDFNFHLPIITRFAMLIPSYSWLFLCLLFTLFLVAYKSFRNADFCMKIPIIGKIKANSLMSDFCYTLSYQLKNGVSFVIAVNSLIDGLDSGQFKMRLVVIIEKIKKGSSLSSAFSSDKLFDGLFTQLVAVGEESGKLGEMLWEAGESFAQEAEYGLKNFTSYIEPVATLFVGGMVAFVALSMILPLFSMVNSLL